MMEISACDVFMKVGEISLKMIIIQMALNPRGVDVMVTYLQVVDQIVNIRTLIPRYGSFYLH